MLRRIFSVFLVVAAFYPAQVFAQGVARVLAVTPGATITTDGKREPLVAGMPVFEGSRVVTNRSGQAELLFGDQTKIAIGPNSNFLVDDVVLASTTRAQNFTFKVTKGAFRFLSGKSRKESYRINTPTATMGIRGTKFDFTVPSGKRATNLLTWSGKVLICNLRNPNRCAQVTGGGCDPVQMPKNGRPIVPESVVDQAGVLVDTMPFAVDERSLTRSLRVNSGQCSSVLASVGVGQNGASAPSANGQGGGTSQAGPGGTGTGVGGTGTTTTGATSGPGQSGSKGQGNSQGGGDSQSQSSGGQGKGHDK